ncbi:hypothetical protein HX063_16940 [Myroides odoratimimus]|nr:hypothetical protein [Myroides odoratimimus]
MILMSREMFSQVGINTQIPLGTFHVDGAKDNQNPPTASQILNDVIVTADGNLGIGTITPITKVDLRSSSGKNIIGLANTSQSAGVAKAGALRYETNIKMLQYSDGVAWHTIPDVAPPKALVFANKESSQSISENSTTQYITNWKEMEDSQNNFNPSTGIFTVPRDGFYIVSFSMTLSSAIINNNSHVETIIESNTSTNNIQTFKTVNSYPGWQAGSQSNQVAGNCYAIFNLKSGNTIRFRVWHNLGGSRTLDIGDSGMRNSISIYEL